MLIRLGFSSGRQGPEDEVPRMRGLAFEFAVRPDGTGASPGMPVQRTPEPASSFTVLRSPRLLADLPAAGVLGDDGERPARLEALCSEFLSRASSFGFGAEEIERLVRQIAEGGEG